MYLFRAEGAKILRIPGATWINAPLVVYLSGTRGGINVIHSYRLIISEYIFLVFKVFFYIWDTI